MPQCCEQRNAAPDALQKPTVGNRVDKGRREHSKGDSGRPIQQYDTVLAEI